jgi:hypothetical protein
MHVRRGDYLHYTGDNGVLPAIYYSRALAKIDGMGKNISRWMIFSEDRDWALTHLSFIPNAEVIDYESSNRDIEDLMIMKSCSAGVIANSSYSWWGAALGDHADRLIISPASYWKNAASNSTHWALPHWTLVEAWA